MYELNRRERLAAQRFLSNISFDGTYNKTKLRDSHKKHRLQLKYEEKLKQPHEHRNVDQTKNLSHFTYLVNENKRIHLRNESTNRPKEDVHADARIVPELSFQLSFSSNECTCSTRSVCFGEVTTHQLEDVTLAASASRQPARQRRNFGNSSCLASGEMTFQLEGLGSSTFRFALTTARSKCSPLLLASVIPFSREPALRLPARPYSRAVGSGKFRNSPDVSLFNSMFRAPAKLIMGAASKSLQRNELSLSQSLPRVCSRPLIAYRPAADMEISFAWLLDPCQQRGLNRTDRISAEHDVSSSLDTVIDDTYEAHERASNSSASLDRITFTKKKPRNVNLLESTNTTNHDNGQKIMYRDPLIFYNPYLLDNPTLAYQSKKRVFHFSGYTTSILNYDRPNEHKRSLNQNFRLHFPDINLTLTKMRSIKSVLSAVATKVNLDLWIVAHAFVLFEKMILKNLTRCTHCGECGSFNYREVTSYLSSLIVLSPGQLFIGKANRKTCAGAALLISAKLNDIKGELMSELIQEIESSLRINRSELLGMELSAFLGLEFLVIPPDGQILPHFHRLHRGLLSAPPQQAASSIPPETLPPARSLRSP